MGYRGLQVVTRDEKGLQGVTGGYKGIEGVILSRKACFLRRTSANTFSRCILYKTKR